MQAPLLFILSLILVSTYAQTANVGAKLNLTLSVPRCDVASASIDAKVIFAGGLVKQGATAVATKVVDIWDNEAKEWLPTANLTVARSQLLALSVRTNLAQQVLFCGGAQDSNVIDIYFANNNTWGTHTLSNARSGLQGTVIGSKVYFSGGFLSVLGLNLASTIEIYDADTGVWSTKLQIVAKINGAITAVGGKALFIGGQTAAGVATAGIDILDVAANVWSSINLTVARTGLAAVSLGAEVGADLEFAVIAGGLLANNTITGIVEVYDGTALTVAGQLSVARYQLHATTDGVRAWFIGGIEAVSPIRLSTRIDIYNPVTEEWGVRVLAQARANISTVSVGADVFVAGGLVGDVATGTFSALVEVFDFIDDVLNPTPSPGVTPTPTPTPTPSPTDTGVECRNTCEDNFDERTANYDDDTTDYTERCGAWAELRDCVSKCALPQLPVADVEARCLIHAPFQNYLCDCNGDGSVASNGELVLAMLGLKENLLAKWQNDISGCRNTNFEAIITQLFFTFQIDQDIHTNGASDIQDELAALLGKHLNQNSARFQFTASSKRSTQETFVDARLSAEVVDPPADGSSATGVACSFVFFMVIAVFHLF